MRSDVSTRLTSANQALDLKVQQRPDGGSIVGVVRDPNGEPIAGAELRNMGNSTAEVRETKTGRDGRFSLKNLFESDQGKEVLVTAKGFAPKRVKVETGPPGAPAEVAIDLELGHTIIGLVTDDKGRPLENVAVYFAQGNHAFSDGGKTTTDAEGRFAFDALPAESPFTFEKQGYSQINDRRLPLDGADVVTVEMIPAGVIVGKVLDAKTGKPVRTFHVGITFSPTRQPGDPSAGLRGDLVNPGQTYQSSEGRFKLGELVVGMPLQVMVSAEGYERHVTERVVAGRSDEPRIDEFALDPIDPANLRAYRGRLVNNEGKPIGGAALRLIAARDRDPDSRGKFPFNWQMIRSGQLAQSAKAAVPRIDDGRSRPFPVRRDSQGFGSGVGLVGQGRRRRSRRPSGTAGRSASLGDRR